MGDLAQAIVSLGRLAERRRGARAELVESTDTIARAIREQLRTGDSVEVERYAPDLLSGIIFGPGTVRYRATRVTSKDAASGRAHDVLARELEGRTVIFGVDETSRSTDYETDQASTAYNANEDDRHAFVHEASAVVAAFQKLLGDQASRFEAAAKKATKLTPR